MKYLALLAVILIGIWWLRQQQRSHKASTKQTKPQIMMPCNHCGIHVPENDTYRGKHGLYCSIEHRHAHES